MGGTALQRCDYIASTSFVIPSHLETRSGEDVRGICFWVAQRFSAAISFASTSFVIPSHLETRSGEEVRGICSFLPPEPLSLSSARTCLGICSFQNAPPPPAAPRFCVLCKMVGFPKKQNPRLTPWVANHIKPYELIVPCGCGGGVAAAAVAAAASFNMR